MAKDWTFQSLIDAKMAVTAHCHHAPCNHSQMLDLVKLRDRFGPDAPAMEWDIRPKLRCKKCNGNRCRPDVHARHQPDRLWQNQGQLVHRGVIAFLVKSIFPCANLAIAKVAGGD
jgi:hypothetical protein